MLIPLDIRIFREDIGEEATVNASKALSRKKPSKVDVIKVACQAIIGDHLLAQRSATLVGAIIAARQQVTQSRHGTRGPRTRAGRAFCSGIRASPKGPTVIPKAVKVESVAKFAFDSHGTRAIAPCLAADMPGLDVAAVNVTLKIGMQHIPHGQPQSHPPRRHVRAGWATLPNPG